MPAASRLNITHDEMQRRKTEDAAIAQREQERLTEVLRAAGYDVYAKPIVWGIDRDRGQAHIVVRQITITRSLD